MLRFANPLIEYFQYPAFVPRSKKCAKFCYVSENNFFSLSHTIDVLIRCTFYKLFCFTCSHTINISHHSIVEPIVYKYICVYTAVELNFYANKIPRRKFCTRGKNSINFHYRWHKKNYFIFYLSSSERMKRVHSECFAYAHTCVFASFNTTR